jgi:hypothetical protein
MNSLPHYWLNFHVDHSQWDKKVSTVFCIEHGIFRANDGNWKVLSFAMRDCVILYIAEMFSTHHRFIMIINYLFVIVTVQCRTRPQPEEITHFPALSFCLHYGQQYYC